MELSPSLSIVMRVVQLNAFEGDKNTEKKPVKPAFFVHTVLTALGNFLLHRGEFDAGDKHIGRLGDFLDLRK